MLLREEHWEQKHAGFTRSNLYQSSLMCVKSRPENGMRSAPHTAVEVGFGGQGGNSHSLLKSSCCPFACGKLIARHPQSLGASGLQRWVSILAKDSDTPMEACLEVGKMNCTQKESFWRSSKNRGKPGPFCCAFWFETGDQQKACICRALEGQAQIELALQFGSATRLHACESACIAQPNGESSTLLDGARPRTSTR